MLKATGQTEGFALDFPGGGTPPFVIVCDVGFRLDAYAEVSGAGT